LSGREQSGGKHKSKQLPEVYVSSSLAVLVDDNDEGATQKDG